MSATLELLEVRRDQEVAKRMELLVKLSEQVERLCFIYKTELSELRRLLTPAS